MAAGISVLFIPLALWGRRFEPAMKSLEVASGDEPVAVPMVEPVEPGVPPGVIVGP
jgi:hypothetical protein